MFYIIAGINLLQYYQYFILIIFVGYLQLTLDTEFRILPRCWECITRGTDLPTCAPKVKIIIV